MRLRRTVLLTLIATLVVPGLLLTSAGLSSAAGSAKGILPSTALLTNAKGATNGCRFTAPRLSIVPQAGLGTTPVLTVKFPDVESCPKSADIHWMSSGNRVYQVLPDGSLAVVKPHGLSWREGGLLPITHSESAMYLGCTDYGLSGRTTLLFDATLQARVDKNDATTTFTAEVERQQTVSC
jgi:hypothetical protein